MNQAFKTKSIYVSALLVVLPLVGCSGANDKTDSANTKSSPTSGDDNSFAVSSLALQDAFKKGKFDERAKELGLSMQFINAVKQCALKQPFMVCLKAEHDKLKNLNDPLQPTPSVAPTSQPQSDQPTSSPSPTDGAKAGGADCKSSSAVVDASATFQFLPPFCDKNSGACYGLSPTLQALEMSLTKKYGVKFGYGSFMVSDPLSRLAACRFEGYSSVVSFTESDASIPCNASVGYFWWNPSPNNGGIIFPKDNPSCVANKSYKLLIQLNCGGKLADACSQNQDWIFNQ